MPIPPETASTFARLALGHVTREYPNKLDHVMNGEGDVRGPRALHPLFYGSFDWHSCVHGYWLLTRLVRTVPELPESAAIRALVDRHLTPGNVAGELAYLEGPNRGTFERTYGWAWLLALAAELALHDDARGRAWHAALAPLARELAGRFVRHLARATYPIRAGTHANAAFALTLALDYATAHGDAALGQAVRDKATGWFAGDRDCQAWEPGGDDFLSPALMEAECMRRVLDPPDFLAWLAGFLPRLAEGEPACLLEPAIVSDRSDAKTCHLDGLNLSRAWCLRGLSRALPQGDPRAPRFDRAVRAHLEASLPHVAGDYVGEHWLATFALLALDGG